ncbi:MULTISPECIES: efflux transporter outer membrane subunit [unclassified Rhizobium]|uniref:efflux transporter outer membrane subunit n=1 Tax=unclassified Rhizobium TaxID=2613769 RepID=UPI00160271D4|nr:MULTISPECIES: efflux transporter outer membrane subunit [unclassified Rhizobium]MBB1247580.1 efflux transporter outer membrane subunit [Rhizobium sp. G21]MCV3764157.1 efflux transporter outer membrane subunit [Rhizobium sp. TRM95796]
MSKNLVALAAFAALMSSCSTNFIAGPDIALTPHFKERVTTKGETIQPTTTWWANFGDSNLNRLVDEALAQNLNVETARERVRQARIVARVNVGAYLPAGGLNASITRSHTNPEGQPSTTFTNNSATVGPTWTLNPFGWAKTSEREKANIEVAKENLNDARLTVIANIATAYMNAQGTGRQIEIAKKSLAVQNNTTQITKAKLEAGSASALDEAQASAQAALTAADIPQLEQARLQYINQIAILLGKEPAALDNLFTKYNAIKRPKVKFNEGIPADLLRNRPDVRLAEQDLNYALADIGVAEADRLPTITLSGSVGPGRSNGVSYNGWSFGPSLNIPIFNQGTLKAAVDLNKSTAKVQYLAYKSAVLTAVKDVEDALVALRKEREHYSRLSVAVSEYRRALELAQQLYDAGNTEFSDVLLAQDSLYTAELQLAQSSQQLALNYIALCQALGGGWAGDEQVMASN